MAAFDSSVSWAVRSELCCSVGRAIATLFELVPWLVLVATVIIVLRPILVRRDESGSVHPDITMALWPVAIAGIFLVALYGGYFGSGIGILMIGALSFISRGDIRHVVALKNFLPFACEAWRSWCWCSRVM